MQVTKVWWDGDKLMAEPIDPATVYKENEVAQPDSTCNRTLRAEGKGYPRTCRKCGKGPCIADRVQPEQEQWDAIPDAFNEWWNADYDDTGNPYRKDSPAYWAWSGWKAASKQPEQEPSCKDCQTESPCRAKGQDLDVCSFYVPPPAAQRQWVGLTDEEIEKACVPLGAAMLSFTEVARAIEAKLRSKNDPTTRSPAAC